MTPFASRLLRDSLAKGQSSFARTLVQASCFDLSAVLGTVHAAASELARAQADDQLIQHGGLLFMPNRYCWLEARNGSRREGVFLDQVEDQIGYLMFSTETRQPGVGMLVLGKDGETFSVHANVQGLRRIDSVLPTVVAGVGLWVAAALLLINAPRGVAAEDKRPHKGLVREVRRLLGFDALRPDTIIRLNGTVVRGDPALGDSDLSGKAFHFCRSHVRRLSSGAITQVRAHWRGDPSIGVSARDYTVIE